MACGRVGIRHSGKCLRRLQAENGRSALSGVRIRRRVREPGWTGGEAGRGSSLREELERQGGAMRGEGAEKARVREMPGTETVEGPRGVRA